MNFVLEGAQKCSSGGKGHFYEENLVWNFAKDTSAKAQGTTAITVGVMGYLEVWGRFHKELRLILGLILRSACYNAGLGLVLSPKISLK